MFLTAAVCGLLSEPFASRFAKLESETGGYNALQGTMGGLIALLGVWSFSFSRDNWLVRCCLVACGVAVLTAPIALVYDMRYGLGLCDGYQQRVFLMSSDQTRLSHGLVWWCHWVIFALMSLEMLWSVLATGHTSGRLKSWSQDSASWVNSKGQSRAKVFFAVLLLAITGLPTYVFLRLLFLPHIPQPSPPHPNSYDQLVQAGKMVDISIDFDPANADRATLRALVKQWQTPLDKMQDALHRPSAIPVGYGQRGVDSPEPFAKLALLLNCQARLAELEDDTEVLLESRLQRLWLCQQLTRGATVHEWSLANDILVYPSMLASIEHFDANACQRFVQEVRAVETAREPLEDILHRDYLFYAHSGWFVRVHQIMEELSGKSRHDLIVRPGYELFEFRLRRLLIAAAMRAYTLVEGMLPKELSQLVPEYLDALPKDPFSSDKEVIQCKMTSNGFSIIAISNRYGDLSSDFKLLDGGGGTVWLTGH